MTVRPRMLRLWNTRRLSNVLDYLSYHVAESRSLVTAPSTETKGTPADTSAAAEPDWSSLTRDLVPAGSALFQENKHFSAVVFPNPLLNWDQLKRSLASRNLTPRIELEELIQMETNIAQLEKKIAALDEQRRIAKSDFARNEDKEKSRHEARRLRSEQKALKNTQSQLFSVFRRETLSFPNTIHESYLPGSKSSLETNLVRGRSKNPIRWTTVQDDLYTTAVGTFLIGKLATLEQSLLVDTRHHWLTAPGSEVPTYPVCLSDFARGPAVEGASWPPVDNAIRVEPTRADLLKVPVQDDRDHGRLWQWLINPHTSTYLVGSASLPSFAAYLLCNRITGSNTLPVRLLSLGSVYQSARSRPGGAVATAADAAATAVNRGDQVDCSSDPSNLLPFQQQKQVSLLELASAWEVCEAGYERLINELNQFWTQFQPIWSMRLEHTPPDRLWPCEMARTVIELVPTAATTDDTNPVQLASVSLIGDWLSRRVSVTASVEAGSSQDRSPYVHMIYARLMDTRSLLEAFQRTGILEQSGLTKGS